MAFIQKNDRQQIIPLLYGGYCVWVVIVSRDGKCQARLLERDVIAGIWR